MELPHQAPVKVVKVISCQVLKVPRIYRFTAGVGIAAAKNIGGAFDAIINLDKSAEAIQKFVTDEKVREAVADQIVQKLANWDDAQTLGELTFDVPLAVTGVGATAKAGAQGIALVSNVTKRTVTVTIKMSRETASTLKERFHNYNGKKTVDLNLDQAPRPKIKNLDVTPENSCFSAGTPLRIPGGSKLIEEFRVGDLVLARDEHDPNGDIVPKVVEEVFKRFTKIVELQIAGQTIRTTPEHPFWFEGRGWCPIHEGSVGDRLLTMDGQYLPIESLAATDEWEVVYNLRIADYHTYFVGCEEWGFSVWAHNADYAVGPQLMNGKYTITGPDGKIVNVPQTTSPMEFATEIKAKEFIQWITEAKELPPWHVDARYSQLIDNWHTARKLGNLVLDRPRRVTNSKHHPNSLSPEPNNVEALWQLAISDDTGVWWAKDADGTFHRFSRPSNGDTHWNGSTSTRIDPITMNNVPHDIQDFFK